MNVFSRKLKLRKKKAKQAQQTPTKTTKEKKQLLLTDQIWKQANIADITIDKVKILKREMKSLCERSFGAPRPPTATGSHSTRNLKKVNRTTNSQEGRDRTAGSPLQDSQRSKEKPKKGPFFAKHGSLSSLNTRQFDFSVFSTQRDPRKQLPSNNFLESSGFIKKSFY